MPIRCPQDPQGHYFRTHCSGFRKNCTIFEHNCSKMPSGTFDFGPSSPLKFSQQIKKSNQGYPRDVWLVPRPPPLEVPNNTSQKTCHSRKVPSIWLPSGRQHLIIYHFISNKTQRDATQHNTTPHPTLSFDLWGAFQRRVSGEVTPPPWGVGGSEERKKRRKGERK